MNTNTAPQLPQEISPDGREVWDWATRFSEHTQKLARARELQQVIAEGESTCGSCSKWMTSDCPRETRDQRGRPTGGPSFKAIKCGQFDMNAWDKQRIADLRAEYDALNATAKPVEQQPGAAA